MSKAKFAVIPGDGIGPEVINEGLKVLKEASKKHHFDYDLDILDYGGARYLKTKEVLSDKEVETLKNYTAIYLGSIGHPEVKPGILEKGILLKLRFGLDQYINLRPVRLYENVETCLKDKGPTDIDYIVFRENSGGLYTGVGEFQNKDTSEEVAVQSMVYTYKQVERCVRYAFDYLQKRHAMNPWRGLSENQKAEGYVAKLTLCGKTNVLTYASDLWERVFYHVAKDFPNILTDYCHVDAICIYMLEDPKRYNGIVTSNMFGDIITDLAAVTQGGMGVAPSGNINPEGVSMFEPVHGSAPSFTGKNEVNPIAAIASLVLMLYTIGQREAAESVEISMTNTIKKMKSQLVGKMGYSTTEIGDMIAEGLH